MKTEFFCVRAVSWRTLMANMFLKELIAFTVEVQWNLKDVIYE